MPARGWHHDPQVQPHPRDIRGNAVPAPIPIVKVREMVRILGEVSDALESSASGLRYLAHRSTPAPTARSAKLTHGEHGARETETVQEAIPIPRSEGRWFRHFALGHGPIMAELIRRIFAGIHDVLWRSVTQRAGLGLDAGHPRISRSPVRARAGQLACGRRPAEGGPGGKR